MGWETDTPQKEHGARQPDRKWHNTDTPNPYVDRMCKNITLPQTSFAGGNYQNVLISVL